MTFTDSNRSAFAALCDVFLPEGSGMPAASRTNASTNGLDTLSSAAPRLALRLREVLSELHQDEKPGSLLARLHREAPADYEVVRCAAGATYYLDPQVRALLRYPGQAPTASIPGHDDGYLIEGLLDHVAERGERFRIVPGSN